MSFLSPFESLVECTIVGKLKNEQTTLYLSISASNRAHFLSWDRDTSNSCTCTLKIKFQSLIRIFFKAMFDLPPLHWVPGSIPSAPLSEGTVVDPTWLDNEMVAPVFPTPIAASLDIIVDPKGVSSDETGDLILTLFLPKVPRQISLQLPLLRVLCL